MSEPKFVYKSHLTGKEYPDFNTMNEAEPDVCKLPGSNYFCYRIDDDEGYNVFIV